MLSLPETALEAEDIWGLPVPYGGERCHVQVMARLMTGVITVNELAVAIVSAVQVWPLLLLLSVYLT